MAKEDLKIASPECSSRFDELIFPDRWAGEVTKPG